MPRPAPFRSHAIRAPLALLLGALSSGCPKASDPASATASPSGSTALQPARPTPSRVHPLRAGDELGGPNATGKPGDWVIENDEVVFIIDGLGGGAGFAESGGNVVDAADARTRKDELGQLFTYFATFPRQGVYTAVDARVEPDGSALVESRGRELYDPSLRVVTQFRLRPGERALRLRTTITNDGSTKVTGFGLGDAIQWGGTEKVAPGKPVGFRGSSKGPYIGAVGRYASYAIASAEGDIAAINGGTWTDTEQRKDVEIPPAGSVTYDRLFVVGERPDVASIVAQLTAKRDVGAVEIALTSTSGAKAPVEPGAKVVLTSERPSEAMTLVAMKEGDTFGGALPAGRYLLSYVPSAGRRGDGTPVNVTVNRGETARVRLAVTEAESVALGPCLEGGRESAPLPCKLTIEGLEGSASPDLGPSHVAGLAKNVVTLRPSERMTVPLPHGRYRVTASRGPEYDLASSEVTVPGAAPPPFALRRVVETKGYVATDFHQHSILSADSPVATRDRVLANAAEGVEVAVASEHNAIADLSPVVKELGLSSFLVQIAGDELTSDASKVPFGHANVFPVEARPDLPRNGAPAVRDRLATEVFAEARALPGGPHVLQINHPRSGKNGYFDQLGFDPRTGVGTGAGYDPVFDALEVWNGRAVGHRTTVLEDFFVLLRTGHPTTPIADTDTHGIVGEEPGYPRTFVRVGEAAEAALDRWDAARTLLLARTIRETRDVVLSNGPFMSVSANGIGIGGVTRPRSGVVDVKVTVTTAPWVAVEKAEIKLARGPAPALSSIALDAKANAAGALVAEATFSLPVKEDDALVVIVRGTKPMRPVLSAVRGDEEEIAPFAMSGPIWIDANGDGKALGRSR